MMKRDWLLKSSPAIRLSLAAGVMVFVAQTAPAAAQSVPAANGDVFTTRKDTKDGSTSGSVGTRLPTEWETKLGVDVGTAAPASTAIDPERLLKPPANDSGSGAAWANATLPGLPTPLGWDKTTIDARVEPAQERGKLGTTLSRSLPLGGDMSMTLQNGYAVTRTLTPEATMAGTPSVGAPLASAESWEANRGVRLNLLSTETTISAGQKLTSTDDKWRRTLSAEQKVYGPLSITGSVSETAAGEANKSVTASFKTRW